MSKSLSQTIIEEYSDLLKLAIGAVVGAYFLGVDFPELPDGWPLAVIGGVALAVVGILAADHIDALYPDPETVDLHVVNAYNTESLEVWELSPAQFEKMEVMNGPLNPLPENKNEAYEVFAYDPDQNLALGTWRKSKPASQIAGHLSVDDALDVIQELRAYFEPEAKRGHHIRQQLPGILRELDARRLDSQARMLETDLSPSFDDETVEDVLDQEMPETLLPNRMQPDDSNNLLGGGNDQEDDALGSWEIEAADGEALEPHDEVRE
jgi:hypothetical protein